jgi:predicted Fe-Mo cluster-binding NifX family protein
MRVAIAVQGDRISPVFDTSSRVLLLDIERKAIVRRTGVALEQQDPRTRVAGLARQGVETLVCGAISRPLAGVAAVFGIRVIPFVAGDVERIITAYINETLPCPELSMPGCGGRRRRRFRGGRGGR